MTEQFDLFCKFAAACDLLTAEELFQEREPAAVFARKEGGDPDQSSDAIAESTASASLFPQARQTETCISSLIHVLLPKR